MSAIEFSPAAYDDLADIWFYTFDHWGSDQADSYVGAIHATLEMVVKNPSAARSIDHARADYWRAKAGRHICYFRLNADRHGIVVMRILHERMDALRHL